MSKYNVNNILKAFEPFKNITDQAKISEQEAAHIVKCVNNYDLLLQIIKETRHECVSNNCDLAKQIDKLLKRAKGEV